MSNKVKDISIKSRNYYFFDDIVDIRNFGLSNIKIDEKSYKNILLYYTGYVTIKDLKYVKINSINSLYLLITEINECFEEINQNKYLTLVKKKLKNMKNCGVKSEI